MKFEIYKSGSGEFYFRLKASNGENILGSEGYSDKSGCKNGIASVQKNCGNDANYERLVSKDGRHYFNLKSGNGQVIGKSQMYQSASSMENGIAAVKKAGDAPTEDTTA